MRDTYPEFSQFKELPAWGFYIRHAKGITFDNVKFIAEKPGDYRPGADQNQYLTFLLGEEMFAIGILSIREIIEYGVVTDVPLTPAFIRGVLNLRQAMAAGEPACRWKTLAGRSRFCAPRIT